MSFVFRVSRGDIESEFPGFIPESPTERFHADRPINSNSAAFLVASVLLLFLFFYSHQMSSDLLLWLVVAVFLMATILKLLATCQQLQAQVRAHAAAASGLLGHAELRLQMPQSIALATRGRLQGLRLQLAQLDREFDELDTLRALDSNFPSASISMSEKEINALPVHNYYVPGSENSSEQLGSSSSALDDVILKKVDSRKIAEGSKTSEDELTCIFCLEQVQKGDLLRSLPCLHQFHTKCIDRWLRLRRTCPVCKFQMSSGWQGCRGSESDASDMV